MKRIALSRPIFVKISCAILGAVVTFFWVWLDTHSRLKRDVSVLSHLGRQVAAQVETLAMVGMQLGRPQPFHWAALQINQGIDPRFISARVKQPSTPLGTGRSTLIFENTQLDQKREILTFSKPIRPENPIELEIQLTYAFSGFLGTKSKGSSDFYIFIAFAILAYFFHSAFTFLLQRKTPTLPNESQLDTAPPFSGPPLQFYQTLKTQMREVNQKWKVYLQNRIQLTNQLFRTQKDSQTLKIKAHEVLNEVHKTRRSMEKMGTLLVQTKNSIHDANIPEDLKRQILMWMDALQATQKSIRSIEVKLEPITLEADLTLQGLLDLCAMQENLAKDLKESGDVMILHAKTIQEYDENIAS